MYDAYENYSWPFTCVNQPLNINVNGTSFQESSVLLNNLKQGLLLSIEANNIVDTRNYCLAILDWGGVLNGNAARVNNKADLVAYFNDCTNRLNPNVFNTDQFVDDIVMTAGFTKLYSLLLEDFIIYDGRVGAALGLLVRQYCQVDNLGQVPNCLLFAWGAARGNFPREALNPRNPSTRNLRFPAIVQGTPHTINNIKANWILRSILDNSDSRFNNEAQPLRALEAALFMIGYDVNGNMV